MTTTPTLTIERTGATYKAVVRFDSGSSVSYNHPTFEAARASGERALALAPQPTTSGAMSFRVAGAGRLMGR